MSYTKRMQGIVTKYRNADQPWPALKTEIAKWAVQNELWAPQPAAIIDQCADDLARAMRDEYITDPQGRRVRAKHVAHVKEDGKQLALWDDIQTASRKHMQSALQGRRRQIVGDCVQLKVDADSYNDNRSPDNPIQISLNFTRDVEEEVFATSAA